MSQEAIVDIIQSAVMTVITVSAPPLILGLLVGLSVSIFQAITSIQEPTMAFVPKIVAVLLSLIFFGFFMISTLQEFTTNILGQIPVLINSAR